MVLFHQGLDQTYFIPIYIITPSLILFSNSHLKKVSSPPSKKQIYLSLKFFSVQRYMVLVHGSLLDLPKQIPASVVPPSMFWFFIRGQKVTVSDVLWIWLCVCDAAFQMV